MHVDCCLVIDFGKFMIQEFGEVESKNFGIQLKNYIVMTIMRKIDGAQPSLRTMFKEDSKGCY